MEFIYEYISVYNYSMLKRPDRPRKLANPKITIIIIINTYFS